jgi:tetratricopeptide (TPR) repeat protein
MELVRGVKITDYCDQNNLSTKERLDLFIQICRAIQHAHQKGIIHRDIKPSNILVTTNDGVAVPKVIDFGIAKATEGRLTDHTLFTAFEQFLGTPAYMSPEQAVMTSLDIDTRSDIHSLGVLLYELLTGQTPFDAKKLLQAGLDEIRRTIREEEPARPSTRLSTMVGADLATIARARKVEPPKLIHSLQGDLDWIVMKALEKDRSRRYETAHGLAADIQRHLENEPVMARPPSTTYRLQKAWRRNKLAFATGAIVAAALLLGVMVSSWQAARATKAEKLAKNRLTEVAAERDAKEEARKDAEAISTFLTEVFQSPDPARDGRTITVAETLINATKKLESELTNQPARRAKIQATLGTTYFALGLYREAITAQEQVRDYYLTNSGQEHPDTLLAMYNLAKSYHWGGRRDEAFKLREEVLALRVKALGPGHPDTLTSMNDLAGSYGAAGRWGEALKLREEALALFRKVLGPAHRDTLWCLNNIAWELATSDAAEIRNGTDAVNFAEEAVAATHRANAGFLDTLAAAYAETQQFDKAVSAEQEAIGLAKSEQEKKDYDSRLKLYQVQKPYRAKANP